MATDQTITVAAPLPRLFYAKAFYFSYFAALGGYIYFLTLYYKQIGLDNREIGLIAGLPPPFASRSLPRPRAPADADCWPDCACVVPFVMLDSPDPFCCALPDLESAFLS